MLQFFVRASVESSVAFVLPLFIPHFSLFLLISAPQEVCLVIVEFLVIVV